MSDITTKLVQDNAGRLQYERMQDVDPYLAMNKYERNNDAGAKTKFARKAATIPNIVIEQWLKEGIDVFKYGICPDTTKRIKAKLNSNDHQYLRTHNSRM